jgi:hypothetical protein
MTFLNTLCREVTLIMAAEKRVVEGAVFLLTCFLLTCSLMFSAIYSAQEIGPVATPVNLHSAEAPSPQHGRFKVSSSASEVARIIGVDSEIARLSELAAAENLNGGPTTSLEELTLRERITEGVVVASLDVDSVLG